jgi:protein-S-isoprenylcysteine O-methyltransferase Ste14
MKAGFVQRGGIWVLLQGLLLTASLAGGLFAADRWNSPAMRSLGIVLLILGAVCGLAGAKALGRNLTPFPQPSSGTQLVRHGVYRWIRHPLYTAVISTALGWALLRQSGLAILPALLLIPFFDAKSRVEERALRQLFPDYSAYTRSSRRFIPWIY